MTQHMHGYSGNSYDRWVERNSNSSTFGKVQKQFWFTKSAVMRKFGKREDEHIVASDGELDSKIELFKAIESSTRELQILLADYQNRICILAQEENNLGRLLKEYGKKDQSRAGKMMTAVGKSLSYTAQQRVAMRGPLVRLFQEVDTFQNRAVEDTCFTVEEMEKVRTEYRGALMWMKNISQDFNPDHYQQLEKFREVQSLVKQKKSKFDQIKIKSLQKIELLAASRCNMFSHALILYQNNLITFSEKTAKTLNTVASNFKGYHPYKFQVIKELVEPQAFMDDDDERVDEKNDEAELEGDDKTFFGAEYHDDKDKNSKQIKNEERINKVRKKDYIKKKSDSLVNLYDDDYDECDKLLSFNEDDSIVNKGKDDKSIPKTFASIDLLSGNDNSTDICQSTQDMLKELFDSPIHEPQNPQQPQALPVFGSNFFSFDVVSSQEKDLNATKKGEASESGLTASSHLFLPSQLIEFGLIEENSTKQNVNQSVPTTLSNSFVLSNHLSQVAEPVSLWPSLNPTQTTPMSPSQADKSGQEMPLTTKKSATLKQEANKLDWYKVFQDIDPLADPGCAIFGKGSEDRSC